MHEYTHPVEGILETLYVLCISVCTHTPSVAGPSGKPHSGLQPRSAGLPHVVTYDTADHLRDQAVEFLSIEPYQRKWPEQSER